MPTVRRRPRNTKETIRAKKTQSAQKKTLTEHQKHQAASVGKCCEECIAKLNAHHANRTAEGEAKFVAMMVDVLSFAASKQATSVRRSLNGLSYKGKVRLKDTSKAELTRFARAAYADKKFMDHYKSKVKIVMHLIYAVILGGVVASIVLKPLYGVYDATLKKKVIEKNGKYETAVETGYVAEAMFAILFAGFGYLFGGTAFRKNLTRLHMIIKKH